MHEFSFLPVNTEPAKGHAEKVISCARDNFFLHDPWRTLYLAAHPLFAATL